MSPSSTRPVTPRMRPARPEPTRRSGRGAPHGESPNRRHTLYVGLAVFAFALVVRLVHLFFMRACPTFYEPVMDPADYDDLARAWLAGRPPHTSLFWQPPFYPLFLAAIYGLTGGSIWAAKGVQCLLGALTATLAWVLGRRVGGARTGLLAGLITALAGPLVFFEGELLATGWAAFWAVTLVCLFGRAANLPSAGLTVLLGLSSALAVLTRPTFVPFLVLAWAWLVWKWVRSGLPSRGWVGCLAAGVVGFMAAAGPAAALNYRLNRHVGILPASGGINFYIGNSAAAEQTTAYRPGRKWEALLAMPVQAGVSGDPWERDRFFYKTALTDIQRAPGAFVLRLASKTLQFLCSRELPRSFDIYVFRSWSPVLRLLVWKAGGFGFPFGVLLPLALLGLINGRARIPTPVWLFLLSYPAAVILVFVSARYRAPLLPVLALPAALGGQALFGFAKTLSWPRLAGSAFGTAAVAVLASWPGPYRIERQDYAAELDFLLGNRFFHLERYEEAAARFEDVLERNPGDPDVHARLAETLLVLGDLDGAREHYQAALRARPGSAVNHACLGIVWERLGDLERAIAEYRRAVTLDPGFARAHSNLGAALERAGRLDEAVEAYRKAARLAPDEPLIRFNLGAALARQGRRAEAMVELQAALKLQPDYAPARELLEALVSRSQTGP